MNSIYMSMAALVFQKEGIFAINSGRQSAPSQIFDYRIPSVLEMFVSPNSIKDAFRAYTSLQESKSSINPIALSAIQSAFEMRRSRIAMLMIFNKVFICSLEALLTAYEIAATETGSDVGLQKTMTEMMSAHNILDLTTLSLDDHLVANTIRAYYFPTNTYNSDSTLEQFTHLVRRSFTDGLLTIPRGAIDFGDLKRLFPFCPDFGYSRGTPIDRYYLNRFVKEVRDDVIGDTLEIGGVIENRQLYGFSRAKTYRVLDIKENTGADIVGDAHHPDICENNTLDSIIIFNVLEHCEKPWVVIDNIYNWLKVGGRVFCMVPNAQRLHDRPKDFWRILPDAMNSLFSKFSVVKLFSYGNPITTVSSMMGVAAEELSSEELDSVNEEYPVITCVFAQKA